MDITAAYQAKRAGRRREVQLHRGALRLTDEALAELRGHIEQLAARFADPGADGTWTRVLLSLVDLQDRPDANPPPGSPHERYQHTPRRAGRPGLRLGTGADRSAAAAQLCRRPADPGRARGTRRRRLRGTDQGPARDLTADLPDAGSSPAGHDRGPAPADHLVVRLSPAGLAYWLLSVREAALLRAWLRNARPWQRLLAGAIVAGAGMALQVFSHLAGAVLVSAGVIFALPAISGPLHRTWVTVRRAFPVRGPRRLSAQRLHRVRRSRPGLNGPCPR